MFPRLSSVCSNGLFRFDRADGASVFASAAINTSVLIDYVDSCVAERDSANGTGISASAASNTFFGNFVCHDRYLPVIVLLLYHNFFN